MVDCRILLPRGDDRTVEITCTNKLTGAAIDITGATITFTVRATETGAVTFQLTIAQATEVLITNATGGVFEVYIVPANTTSLSAGLFHFDAQVVLASGKTYTVVKGILELEGDITYT